MLESWTKHKVREELNRSCNIGEANEQTTFQIRTKSQRYCQSISSTDVARATEFLQHCVLLKISLVFFFNCTFHDFMFPQSTLNNFSSPNYHDYYGARN